MKNICIILLVYLISLNVTGQESKSNSENPTKSVQLINQDYVRADSIITFKFNGLNDSTVTQKQYNRLDGQNQKSEYESWNWNAYTQSWNGYLGVMQKVGNMEVTTTYSWDADSVKYIETGKTELEKTENYERSSYFTYNADTKTFEENSKSETWFNVKNLDSIYFEYSKNNMSGELEYNRKVTTIYDTTYLKIQENKYNWENGSWKQTAKLDFGYDTLRNLIQQNWYITSLGNLYNNRRDFYSYDSLYNLINVKTTLFNNDQWQNSTNQIAEFDSLSRNILTVNQTWDLTNSEWENVNKTETTYEEAELKSTMDNGLKTERINYQWLDDSWHKQSVQSNITNESGIIVEFSGKSWIAAMQQWSNFYRTSYDYHNETGLLLLGTNENKSNEDDNWLLYTKIYYYYNGINVFQKAPELESNLISLFPNPAGKKITVVQQSPSEMKINIFNLYGKLVHSELLSETAKTIDISKFNAGVYIFQLEKNGLQESHKILKIN